MAILNVPIQVRVDNEQNWDNSTLILKDGEPALCKKEDGTQELKFGDGQKTYKELSPFGGNQVEENSGDLLVTLTSIENNQASATYEQIKATINNKHLVAVIYEEEVYMLDKVQSNGTIEFRLDNSQGQKYLGISSSGVWYENSSSWQAVNISIDEVEGLEATNVQDALAELKENGVQLNDDAVNATEAWSSKKIVDTLCPSFSVSGNPVICHPVEGYPLSAVVTLKPKQAGSGDPSPENVRPISGYDSVTVTRCGKNLFGGGEENVWIGVGGIVATVQGAYSTGIIPCKEGDKFTLSTTGQFAAAPNNSGCICFYNLEYELVARTPISIGKSLTEIVPSGGSYVRASSFHVGSDNIQLELGSTPTPYEPYQGSTTTLTLPETIYGGTVDAVTGVGSKTWRLVEFDGTESWLLYNNTGGVVKTFYVNIGVEPYANYINILCDRASFLFSTWNKDEPWTISSSSVTNAIYISVPNDVASAVEQWKSYLAAQASAGTPLQVAYKLATPEPFQATGNQALPAVAGLNTVYTDGDRLAVSGRSDPTAYIQQQISDAITAAVAITGGT